MLRVVIGGLLTCLAVASVSAGSGVDLRIYANETDAAPFTRLNLGHDRDAVCTRGFCDDGTTVCLTNANCTSGSCNYTPCTSDFALCEDGVKICDSATDCTGIGGGQCIDMACDDPPNTFCGVKVDSLTPGAPVEQTAWQLVCNPLTPPHGTDCQVGLSLPATTVSWDFSNFNTTTYSDLSPTASTVTLIDATETDDWNECGFAAPGRVLGREDKNYTDPPNNVATLNSIERQNGTTDTLWLRGVVRFDDIPAPSLGLGESRLCMVDDGRPEVPLWSFANDEPGVGKYMELGDPRWDHTAFNCDPIILAPVGVDAFNNASFEGKQTGEVVNEGVVRLPSGHQFESLVVRSIAEYRAAFLCIFGAEDIRTVLYLWQVPHLGTVVRLQSDKIAVNRWDFQHLSEVDIKHGLFPPLSVTVGSVTDDSVDLSWDPGLITSHIDGYRIYWDTESGGVCSVGGEDCTADHPGAGNCPAGETCCSAVGAFCTSYQNDSVNDAGQVVFNTATSATISGLDPSTTYYFTVSSMADFTDPASSVTTTYESVKYPTQLPAVPVDLPLEVSAATTAGGGGAGATPNGGIRAGTPLILDRATGTMLALSWGGSCEAADTDYVIYEGTLGTFTSHVPLNSCTTAGATNLDIEPAGGSTYYLVVPQGATVEGSYGLDSVPAERLPSVAACETQAIGCP